MSRIGNLSSRIFVGGLDPVVDESDLKKAFALFGEITNIMLMRDRENGRSRGFAFISFKDSMSSDDAISRMHGVEIRGRCVTVRHAERERFLDDKNQTARPNPTVGTQFRDSQYGGPKYHMPVSKTVYVTEDDDQDYSRGASYKRRRSSSPGNTGFSSNFDGDKNAYRERSPHNRYDRQKVQGDQDTYYEGHSSNLPSRLSPTAELSAYVHSRYKDHSSQFEFAKPGRTDSADYRKSGQANQSVYRSRGGESPPAQERSRPNYDQQHQRQILDDRRRSPDTSRFQRTQGSYGRISQQRDDMERRSRNASDSRRSDSDRGSPQHFQRSRNYQRDRSPENKRSSWDKSKQQRSPQNSYRDYNQGTSKDGRDQKRDFQSSRNEDFQRSRHSDVSGYGKSNNSSNGGGTSWDRNSRDSRYPDATQYGKRDNVSYDGGSRNQNSREGSSYQSRNRSSDWNNRDSRQDRNMSSTQSLKRESSDRGLDRSKDFQRTDEYGRGSGADYRKSRYHGEDRERGRSNESYRAGGSRRGQSGRGHYQNNRGRRY